MPPRKASSKGKQKASATDEEENFALNILVLGEMSCFLVHVPQNVQVDQLRETIYQKRERRFRDVQADDLTLYKVEIDFETHTSLSKLKKDEVDTVTLTNPSEVVSQLWGEQPSSKTIHVLVDPHHAVHAPSNQDMGSVGVDSILVKQYENMFITVDNLGDWTRTDVLNNQIHEALADQIPSFIEDYEQVLATRRRVPTDLDASAQVLLAETFDDYCSQSSGAAGAVSGSSSMQDSMASNEVMKDELVHLGYISHVEPSKCRLRKGHPRNFKEPDAAWLLFYTMSYPYELNEDNERSIAVKVGESWPFEIIVKNNQNEHHSYKPKSDFAALGSSLLHLLIEVNSTQPTQPPKDRFQMLLQAGSIIQFANKHLDTYKANKRFILVAAYIGHDRDVERYILFQDKDRKDLQKVYYKRKTFKLNIQVNHVQFALELYNFFSLLGNEGYNKDTANKTYVYRHSFTNFHSNFNLPTLTGCTHKHPHTNGKAKHDSNIHGTGSGGGRAVQLETHGYVLIPDYIEDKGGQMESLVKLPGHIHSVYQSTDTTKKELIAKYINEESTELKILKYLWTIQPQCIHIIMPIDTVPTITGSWAIFPKVHSVEVYLSKDQLCGRLAQFGSNLIEGLAYLYGLGVAHLNIKPGNLVYSNNFHLKIIDFDSAVQVKFEDDVIEGLHGTQGWRAPEIQEGSMFSPIRADRWSCGKVLSCFVEKGGMEDSGADLERFADQLMEDNPLDRPSLANWSERLDITLCDDDDADENSKPQIKNVIVTDDGLRNTTKRRKVDVRLAVQEHVL